MLKTMFWKYQRPNTIPSWRFFAFFSFLADSSDDSDSPPSGFAAAGTDLDLLVIERKGFSRIWRLGICGRLSGYWQLKGLSAAAAAWRAEKRVGFCRIRVRPGFREADRFKEIIFD